MSNTEGPRFGILGVAAFIGILIYLGLQQLHVAFSFAAIYAITVFISTSVLYVLWGSFSPEFSGIFKGPMFISHGGCVGTVVGKPIPATGGKITYYVSISKAYIPRFMRKSMTWRGITDLLSGTQIVPVTDYESKFLTLNPIESEAPEGVIMYTGRIDGKTITGRDSFIIKRLDYYGARDSQFEEFYNQLMAQTANMRASTNTELQAAADTLEKMATKVKRVIMVNKGGSNNAATTISEEMQ